MICPGAVLPAMRLTLALILAGLLIVPVAAAGPNSHAAAKAHDAVDSGERGGDADASEGKRHNATAFATWRATLKSLLASWHENASAIRERCHAAEKPDNATGNETKAWAHCIRDGYKAFLEGLRADLKQARLARSS